MYQTDKLLSALSNKARREAMRLLMDGSEHCLCELMQTLKVAQPTMSRHMRTLKLAGLVKDQRKAQWVHFRLSEDLPKQVKTLVEATLALPEQQITSDSDADTSKVA